MHAIAAAIVYAKTAEDAYMRAEEVFEKLVKASSIDAYLLLKEHDIASVPYSWSKYSLVAKTSSREGKLGR